VDDAVDHGRGDDVVGEGLAPAPEGQIAGDHDRADLVAGGDELEEQIRGVLIEGDVTDLVDDDQLVAADLLQLGLKASGLMRFGEAGDPVVRGVEEDRVAGVGRFDPEPDREVGLPEPTPSRRATSLIGTPSARCSRRISAQSSTFSTSPASGGVNIPGRRIRMIVATPEVRVEVYRAPWRTPPPACPSRAACAAGG
jgi:hypothetical protein